MQAQRDNNHKTKDEIEKIFSEGGLTVSLNHTNRYLMRAEAEGIICSGALFEKKQTYALLDERISNRKHIHKEEALARLAKRYMQSHSPATLQDFIWWSGLTIKECREAFGLINNELIKDRFESTDLYIHESYKECRRATKDMFHLLPAYDEYIISYKNRSNVLDLEHHSKAFNNYGIFQPIILYNGHSVGNWKKVKRAKRIDIQTTFWNSDFLLDKELLKQAEDKFQHYSNL